jgi:hypothetical protein
VRIRPVWIALALCLLATQTAIAFLPQAASAELTEARCDTAPGAIFPQPVNDYEVGTAFMPEAVTFAYEVPREEIPPAANFTAVANWGDGTTAPATVENGLVDGCFIVSAPSHVYASPGTNAFSYTIHDSKTGLDHTLDARQLHIWSGIPSLVGGPASRVIRPTIGVPWSGVVAEFSVEPPALSFAYEAQIEWEAGEPAQPGTISPVSDNTWAVSGSFTYAAAPLGGTVSVLISKSHGPPLGKWATASVDVQGVLAPDVLPPAPLRFRGQPILAAIPRAAGAPLYDLVFRTDQLLPQTSSGHVGALVEVDGRTNPVSDLLARHGSTCYLARANGIGKRKLKAGARYPFTLAIDAGSAARESSHAVLRRFTSLSRMRSASSRALGCD